jgi:sulfoxide reductase heme-binding subunit YedZ
MRDIRFLKQLTLVNGLVPLALLVLDGYRHNLGANPHEFATRATGVLALMFLILSLAVTPVRKLLGQPWLAPLRRQMGLLGFFYGGLHLLTYVWFDKAFRIGAISADVVRRPFILVGMTSFLLLVPLAVSSNVRVIRWLGGRRWNRLHQLAYVTATGGAVHYYLLVKADTRVPLAFAGVLAALFGYRLLNRFLPQYTERKLARETRLQPRRGTPPRPSLGGKT